MIDSDEQVILVDENDVAIGLCPKIEAHQEGKLHRAFSLFIFDEQGRMLIQKRAESKYHSAGLWANSCCGHPRDGEDVADAVLRRSKEELGISPVGIEKAFIAGYRLLLENYMIEHEFTHVFFGKIDGVPVPDANEVEELAWVPIGHLIPMREKNPDKFAAWFTHYIDYYFDEIQQRVLPSRG